MTISPTQLIRALEDVLDDCGPTIVACSGGIDSLLLATVTHAHAPASTVVAHTVTPAVPSDGTARVMAHARTNGWNLEIVRSGEFEDERYLKNPTDRCYYCKTNLYDAVADLRQAGAAPGGSVIVSGANVDDLGDYRPGLIAADEHDVRHPYLEAKMGKAEIRAVAAHLGLVEADLPASPCLASRLYTGTRVTANRMRAIELGEAILREAGFVIARCRVREADVMVEVPQDDRSAVTSELLLDIESAMRAVEPSIASVSLDDRPYRAGQAVLHVS